jgi:hypothetical protein
MRPLTAQSKSFRKPHSEKTTSREFREEVKRIFSARAYLRGYPIGDVHPRTWLLSPTPVFHLEAVNLGSLLKNTAAQKWGFMNSINSGGVSNAAGESGSQSQIETASEQHIDIGWKSIVWLTVGAMVGLVASMALVEFWSRVGPDRRIDSMSAI